MVAKDGASLNVLYRFICNLTLLQLRDALVFPSSPPTSRHSQDEETSIRSSALV